MSFVQAGVAEFHPWGCRAGHLEQPDRLIFDLDPGEDAPWEAVIEAARELRDRLETCSLKSFVKTSGSKGLHVVVPAASRLGRSDRCKVWKAEGTRSNVVTASVAESIRSKRFWFPGLIVVVYFFPPISWMTTLPPCASSYLPVTGAGPFVSGAAGAGEPVSGAAGAALSCTRLAATVMLTVLSVRKTRCSGPRVDFHSPTIWLFTLGSECASLEMARRSKDTPGKGSCDRERYPWFVAQFWTESRNRWRCRFRAADPRPRRGSAGVSRYYGAFTRRAPGLA